MKLFPTKIEIPNGEETFQFHIQNNTGTRNNDDDDEHGQDSDELLLFKVRRTEPKLIDFAPKQGLIEPGKIVDVACQLANANITFAKVTVKLVVIARSALIALVRGDSSCPRAATLDISNPSAAEFDRYWALACKGEGKNEANVAKKVVTVKNMEYAVRLRDDVKLSSSQQSMDTSFYRQASATTPTASPRITSGRNEDADDLLSEATFYSDLSNSEDRRNKHQNRQREERVQRDQQRSSRQTSTHEQGHRQEADKRQRHERPNLAVNTELPTASIQPIIQTTTAANTQPQQQQSPRAALPLDAILNQISSSLPAFLQSGVPGAGTGAGVGVGGAEIDAHAQTRNIYLGVGLGLAAAIIQPQLQAQQQAQQLQQHTQVVAQPQPQPQVQQPQANTQANTYPAPLSPIASAQQDVETKEKKLQEIYARKPQTHTDDNSNMFSSTVRTVDTDLLANNNNGDNITDEDENGDGDDHNNEDDFFVTQIGASPMRTPTSPSKAVHTHTNTQQQQSNTTELASRPKASRPNMHINTLRANMDAISADDEDDDDIENGGITDIDDANNDILDTNNIDTHRKHLLANSKLCAWSDAHVCRHHLNEEIAIYADQRHISVLQTDKQFYVEVNGASMTNEMVKEAIELRKYLDVFFAIFSESADVSTPVFSQCIFVVQYCV
jgi:hypothetical protein